MSEKGQTVERAQLVGRRSWLRLPASRGRPRGHAARSASGAGVIAVVGLVGAVLVVASLTFAPGWPVYVAIVAGVVTGCVAAGWARR
jgi:hypothetical protein